MESMLRAETSLIKDYVTRQEDLLTAYSKTPMVRDLLKDVNNKEKLESVQAYTEYFYESLENWEGIYVGEWNTHCIVHNDPEIVGVTFREGEPLKKLQDAMLSNKGLYNAGIIVSPASGKLILSMYCPVFDTDKSTILGYVGGGPFVEDLQNIMGELQDESDTADYYMINVQTGMYILANDNSLIATDIKDEMLINIINLINGGKETGEITYNGDNGKMVASYQYIDEHGWAVVSADSEKNIYSAASKNMLILGQICIIFVLVISILAFVMIFFSTKPLRYIEESIIRLSSLKLQRNNKLKPWIGTKNYGKSKGD